MPVHGERAKKCDTPDQPDPVMHRPKPTTPPKRRQQAQEQNRLKRQQPSISQIERAIGAGRYRDIDARELEEEEKSKFDYISMSFSGKFEGPVEKRLRETGERLSNWTESGFRASGKKVLLVSVQWVLPIWTFSLLVASGVIKLPFSTPFLDDLIM